MTVAEEAELYRRLWAAKRELAESQARIRIIEEVIEREHPVSLVRNG